MTSNPGLPDGPPTAAERRVFVQYLNPEILRLYGVVGRYTERAILKHALLLTRYAVLLTERDVILPRSYLYEVHIIDPFLRALREAREAGMFSVASETADAAEYLPRKRREYRGELVLFDAYGNEQDDELIASLGWAPRIERSTSRDIADDWSVALDEGEWNDIIGRGIRHRDDSPSLIEEAIASVPERLEGQAFILRYALPLLPVTPEPRGVTRIDMMLSRAYLRSYLEEYGALVLGETPLGDLTCGLPPLDARGQVRVVSYRRLATFFEHLGSRDMIERRLTWRSLLKLRSEPVFQWVLGLLIEGRTPNLPAVAAGILQSRYRPRRTGSSLLGEVLDRLWRLFEALDPATTAESPFVVGAPAPRARAPRGAARELTQPRLWSPVVTKQNNDVFLVCGRDDPANQGMKDMLRAASLTPVEWEEAVGWTGSASPYVLDVLDAAFARVQAVLILFTPDEEVRLLKEHLRPDDPEYERRAGKQARPNVLIEAGMALALHPQRTVIVEIPPLRPFSDLQGLHAVRFDGSAKSRTAVIGRLETAGCKPRGSDYLTAGFSYLAST